MKQGRFLILVAAIGALVGGCGGSKFGRFNLRQIPAAGFAMATCDGDPRTSLATFDMQLQPEEGTFENPDDEVFGLFLFPINVRRPGETINITVANNQTLAFRELVNRVFLRPGTTIFAGSLTRKELEQDYNTISIAQYIPGVKPLDAKPKFSNLCSLLVPGQGVSDGTAAQ